MPRTLATRLLLLVLASIAVLVPIAALSAATASAHNSLVSSDPADGATLTVAPTQITWTFDRTVPLDTMTVTLIDATGVRTELGGSTHGPGGDAVVITPLPALEPGPVSVRWRLVGPDGHPVTGRVDLTIAPAASTTSTPGAVEAPPPATGSTPPAVVDVDEVDDGTYSTSSAARWVLRYGSYLAIMAVVGILTTSAFVWADAGTHPLLRRILGSALLAVAALALLQLLVVASDVGGEPPWASVGGIDAATTTDAGMALAIRIVVALAMWVVLFRLRVVHTDVYWTAVSVPGLVLLGTWAFAGHSSSMRWPELGVLTDVAHHAAAAAWIAGLAIVGWIVIPTQTPPVVVPAVRRFSRVALVSVVILVGTGLIQSWRLVGSPGDLLDADHGQYLAVKVAVLVAMLALANVNRRRVDRTLDDDTRLSQEVGPLRRAMVAELAIGLVIVGITAAMVVSPPSTADAGDTEPTGRAENANIYYVV